MAKVTFGELRMRRFRHGITARQMSDRMGLSYNYVLLLEREQHRPVGDGQRVRYAEALDSLVAEKKAAKR